MKEDWFIIVNPHAGSGKTLHVWKKAELLLQQRGIPFTASFTDCRYHAVELAAAACAKGYRRLMAVGGDGTLHEVLGGIMKFVTAPENVACSLDEFTLGVIPIGSGNDWIRTHRIRNEVSHVVDLMAEGRTVRQDVVKVSILDPTSPRKEVVSRSCYMVNVGGVGLDARICRHVNRVKERGKGGPLVYVKAFFTELARYRTPAFEVFCDGKRVVNGACFSLAFGLGKYSGGGFRQTPEAVTDDGLLDVTCYEPVRKPTVILGGLILLTGRILGFRKKVHAFRARKVVVRPLGNKVNEPVEVDGEILGQAPVMLEIYPQQIRVVSALDVRQ